MTVSEYKCTMGSGKMPQGLLADKNGKYATIDGCFYQVTVNAE